MVLCGASVINAFLRGESSQIIVSPAEAAGVLEEASKACQQCLDHLRPILSPVKPNQAAGVGTTSTGVNPPHHARYAFVCLLEVPVWNDGRA